MNNICKRTLAELIADRERLLLEKQENNDVLAACRAQVESAKARQSVTGERADAKWFASVSTRARYAGQDDQRIASRLAELRELIREAKQRERELGRPIPSGDQDAIRLLVDALNLIQQALDLIRAGGDADV